MLHAEEVKDLINRYGRSGIAFIFGLDFELERGFFIEKPHEQKEILWRVGHHSNFERCHVYRNDTFHARSIPQEEFALKFSEVQQGLYKGYSFLTNLTIRTEVKTGYSLEEILYACNSPYALLLPERFVCFSPETFVKINENGRIFSFPMKGTISADIPNAGEIILNDPKEMAEHMTVVDLIRSDLSRVATEVRVDQLRYLDQLETSSGNIIQVSSQISGQLPSDFCAHLGDILFHLLPAGSVSGAPKPSTLNIIRQAERMDRGYYCGVFGYFDGKQLDSAVAIRFIEQQGDKFFFRSGSGITVNSRMDLEYAEDHKKIYLPFLTTN